MKVAVFSESEADEAAVRILADGILGIATEVPLGQPIRVRSRGWPAVVNLLPAVLKHLRYASDAAGLIVIADSDLTPVHVPAHEEPSGIEANCRLCQIRSVISDVKQSLRAIAGRPSIKTAIGLAVPQLEAWFRVGVDPHVSEASWITSLRDRVHIFNHRVLKQTVYGTDRPSIELETRRAREETQRIVRDGHLSLLEQSFPGGFGALAKDLRAW
jgi:hypothetical protein